MGKTADKYFVTDPWQIIEEGFDPEHGKIAESIFSIANEFMGVRGFFEEDYSGAKLIGSYFNGVYDAEQLSRTGYKGVVLETEFMVNAANWLAVHLFLGEERLDLAKSAFRDFRRSLDLKTGELVRSFIWIAADGRETALEFKRLVSMEEEHLAAQQIRITPLNYSGELTLGAEIDFGIIHEMYARNCWKNVQGKVLGDGQPYAAAASAVTEFRDKPLRSISVFRTRGAEGQADSEDGETVVGLRFALPVRQGETTVFERLVWNDKTELCGTEEEIAARLQGVQYDEVLEGNRRWWGRVWQDCDIRIDGDEENQQGIRFCIFQLFQTYHGADGSNNIGAKGLTGEGYNGNAFWDTETYCLPFFLFNNEKAAKSLLNFRYRTLPQALERARALDCEGAFYPIATISGTECCNLWQHASLQLQASTAVAYGIWDYVKMTGDREFYLNGGLEMLVQICRMLATRGAWSGDGSHYSYYCVMGPDEFEMMVNHNYYTNLMGKFTLEYTLRALEETGEERPAELTALTKRLGVTEEEKANWQRIADGMLLRYDEETQLFEQHDQFFDLPHVDVDSIPDSDFPLYEHWTYDRIYRNDIIKQPDVLMAMFLFPHRYTQEQLLANYEYYEPRCIHESSLSPSVHSILAAGLGKLDEAFSFFQFATRMDLDNYNRNTGDGLHTTSIAAAWMNIVYGFGGLRSDGDVPELAPWLPEAWEGYAFHITYRGTVIAVSVDRDEVRLSVEAETDAGQEPSGTEPDLGQGAKPGKAKPVRIRVYGQEYELTDSVIIGRK